MPVKKKKNIKETEMDMEMEIKKAGSGDYNVVETSSEGGGEQL